MAAALAVPAFPDPAAAPGGVRSRATIAFAALALIPVALPAVAALGGDVASVAADRVRMKAVMRAEADPGVHAYLTPAGTLVREYAGPDGRIYAVTWAGPFMPDLQQLLGEHWAGYLEAACGRAGRGALRIDAGTFSAQVSGRLRAFRGRAWLPGSVPPGVVIDALP